MKHKILYGLMSLVMLCTFVACSDDNGLDTGKITIPKGQPTNITLAANEAEGRITLNSNADISAWVSDVKDGSPASDIEWIEVNQPHKDDGTWYINYNLQTNTTGASRTAYIVVVAEDEKLSFTITQSDETDPDIPSAILTGMIEIKCEAFEPAADNSGTYLSNGVSYFALTLDGGMPREMVHFWTDDLDNGPGQIGVTQCENRQITTFYHDNNGIQAEIANYERYLTSGREEKMVVSRHSMDFIGYRRIAKSGTYHWTDEPGIAQWEPVYSSKGGHIEQMKHTDTDGEEHVYIFTWKDNLLTKIEEQGTGNTVTFSYANPSLRNLYMTFDLNWVLPTELETLDFAAGDVTKIWAALGYIGMPSELYATEISEYIKHDNLTYTYRMNYEPHPYRGIKVNVAHLVNGVQDSYKIWEFNFCNMQ